MLSGMTNLRADQWHDFSVMIGGASGALTGLLFVSVSLNASRIAGHAGLRASAAQTLVLFVTPLVATALLLAPDQPDEVIGAELVALSVLAGAVLERLGQGRRGFAPEDAWLMRLFDRSATILVTMLLIMASGVALVARGEFGFYLLVPAVIAALVTGIVNAWFFLLPLPAQESEHAHHPTRPDPRKIP
jgi:modulator of FtsH protease